MADERKVLAHSAEQIDEAVEKVLDGTVATKTDLQNKPSKSPVHVDDANDVTKSGFYTCKTNVPFGYGLANVLAVGDIDDPNNIFTQIAFGINLNPVNRNAIAVRCYVPGEGFKDWEWVNPPMTLGIEYRTTERYLGKPVYALLYQFDALPNGEGKKYGVSSGVDQIVSIHPQMVHSSGSKFAGVIPGLQSYWAGVSASGGDMYIAVKTTEDLSGYTAYFLVKYTKV